MIVEVDFSRLDKSLLVPDEDWLMFHDGILVDDSRHDDLCDGLIMTQWSRGALCGRNPSFTLAQ